MISPYFKGQTLDDVMHEVIDAIMAHGSQIHPSKGPATELTGVLVEITDPRARLSRTETRGKPFSCLGELCWYLAKTNDLAFISYYISNYQQYAEGDIIFGGYGPRLFCNRGVDQVANVIALLKRKPDSRRAVIQLFEADDIVEHHEDIPCTCTLQFMIRDGMLDMFTYMRSNDVFLGLPHDVFSFTMLQEIMARSLSVELGHYKHIVGSLHLYDSDETIAKQFLDEGWQSIIPMPAIPMGDPWAAIEFLRNAESMLRTNQALEIAAIEDIDPYWADLIRLLQIHRYRKERDSGKIREIRNKISSSVYIPFIDKVLQHLSSKSRTDHN